MTLDEARESITWYVEHGRPTGGFLRAVLANDLMGAMGRADESSRANLYAICCYIYNEIPGNVHGSYERIEAHLAAKRDERSCLEASE